MQGYTHVTTCSLLPLLPQCGHTKEAIVLIYTSVSVLHSPAVPHSQHPLVGVLCPMGIVGLEVHIHCPVPSGRGE